MKRTDTIRFFAISMFAAVAANAAIIVPDRYLLDDYQFTTNNFGLSTDTALRDVWRYKERTPATDSDVQILSHIDDSVAGNNDSFIPPSDLFTHGAATMPYYDVNKTALESITPDFGSDSFVYTDFNQDLMLQSKGAAGLQDYQAWYVITLDTAAGVFAGTSDSANIMDGTAADTAQLRKNLADAWNVLAWDSDPFAGGGIAYTNINSVSVEFFYSNVVANTADTFWFNIRNAPIKYTASIDAVDGDAPAAPTGLAIELTGGTEIKLTWDNSVSVDVQSYDVKRSLSSGSGFSTITNIAHAGTGSMFTDTDLAPTTTYYYVVSSIDFAGNESAATNEVSATTLDPNALPSGSIVSLNFFKADNNAQRIDNPETYGVAALSTVVSNWNNFGVNSGTDLLFEDGTLSSVAYTKAGAMSTFNNNYTNTVLVAGVTDYKGTPGGSTVSLSGLNSNFVDGCYAIVYVNGFTAAIGASISDGTTTNYFKPDVVNNNPALVEITDTNPADGYDVGNYVVFGSAEAPLTDDVVTFEVTTLENGGGVAICAVQLVAASGAPPSGYAAWEIAYDIVADGPDGDSDFEGTINRVEYAVMGNPTNPADNGFFEVAVNEDGGTNWFDYVYARLKDDNSITYTLETGTDLVYTNWTTAGYTELPLTGELGNGYEAVTNRVPTTESKTFVRLLIGEAL